MSTILYESTNNISYIYLNRTAQYNALNKEMLEALLHVVEKVEASKDPVVIISGNGKAFCAGGDINMLTQFGKRKYYEEVMETIETIILKLYMMPKIVISAIQGSAVGLGLSLALTADYIVAQTEAKLGVLFIGIGLAPDGGGHFFLSERLGVHTAKQFTWGKRQVKGKEAKAMGLVDVITGRKVVEEATEIGQELLSSPLVAMLKTKMIYHSKKEETLKHYLQDERKTQWELRNTEDHREGVKAFLEKRQPNFNGR